MRNKHKAKNTFPPLSFFQASPSFLHLSHHYLPPPSSEEEQGMQVVVSL